jgi:tetratricopeptide (TPR) repeat protein
MAPVLAVLLGAAPVAAQRIAVLPMTNTAGPEYDALARGLDDAVLRIIDALGVKRPGLEAVPPDSVVALGAVGTSQLVEMLRADAVLRSELRVVESAATVRMELAEPGRRSPRGSAQVSDDVATLAHHAPALLPAVARALDIRMTHADRERLAGVETTPEALDAFLEGERLRNIEGSTDLRGRATRSYRLASELDPGLVEAAAGIVEIICLQYRDLEDEALIDRSVALTDSLTSIAPNNDRGLRARAMLLVTQGRADEALELLKSVPASLTDDSVVAQLRGLALYDLGRRDEGDAAFRLMIEEHPSHWRGYMELGVSMFGVQAFGEALALFSQAVSLNPMAAKAWSNIGGVHHVLGDVTSSIEAFERSLAVQPNTDMWRNLAVVYYRSGDYESAERSALEGLALTPSRYDIWGALGTIRRQAHDYEGSDEAYRRAVQEAEELLRLSPEDVLLMLDLAGYYGMVGRESDAEPLLERALALQSDDFRVLSKAGQMYEVIGNRDRALELIEEALRGGLPPEWPGKDPGLANLREDPRYGEMLDRLGLSRGE